MLDLTIIVVTSPAPSNPATDIISQSIESCSQVDGLAECPVIIIMDGFKVGPVDRTKMGRITEETAARYELYHQALLRKYSGPRYKIVRNETHQGFGFSVKAGLEMCETTYCIVSQYDRMFCAPFHRINDLIQSMEDNVNIRYIGFPSSTNTSHDKFITTNYNLKCLNTPEVKLSLGDSLYLQPAVFWYDSQHLGHVKRYLEIYRPYKNLPPHLRDVIGIYSIKDMLLRPGDFIEDRFGQVQRRLLWVLATKGKVTKEVMKGKAALVPAESADSESDSEEGPLVSDGTDEVNESKSMELGKDCSNVEDFDGTVSASVPALDVDMGIVVELFKWYGTYLCWQNTSATPFDVHTARNDTVVMVRHLRGRQMTLSNVAWKLSGPPKAANDVAASIDQEVQKESSEREIGADSKTDL